MLLTRPRVRLAVTQTQSLRRTFAYGEVFMGMVMFLLFFLALAYVSPFAPDFNMVAMFRKSNSVSVAATVPHAPARLTDRIRVGACTA